MKIDFKDFYYEWPMKQPIPIEKYYLDEGRMLNARQMTYSFVEEEEGMEPTFEVNDVILYQHNDEPYVIEKVERFANEIYAEKLDSNMNRMGKFTWFEEHDIYHKLKDVVWINKP